MKTQRRWLFGILFASTFLLAAPVIYAHAGHDKKVRWDIISIQFNAGGPGVPAFNKDGVAFALAQNHVSPFVPFKIMFTGGGTFPDKRGPSGDVSGGGTWETFDENGISTGFGTYRVLGLASWEFDNFQTGEAIDNIANVKKRANGNAVLRIRYSDGSRGVLLIGCHGPGASNGIVEGVGASKDQVTYWNIQVPPAAIPPALPADINRTLFHVLHGS